MKQETHCYPQRLHIDQVAILPSSFHHSQVIVEDAPLAQSLIVHFLATAYRCAIPMAPG